MTIATPASVTCRLAVGFGILPSVRRTPQCSEGCSDWVIPGLLLNKTHLWKGPKPLRLAPRQPHDADAAASDVIF